LAKAAAMTLEQLVDGRHVTVSGATDKLFGIKFAVRHGSTLLTDLGKTWEI
jgi:hypothetical protein